MRQKALFSISCYHGYENYLVVGLSSHESKLTSFAAAFSNFDNPLRILDSFKTFYVLNQIASLVYSVEQLQFILLFHHYS